MSFSEEDLEVEVVELETEYAVSEGSSQGPKSGPAGREHWWVTCVLFRRLGGVKRSHAAAANDERDNATGQHGSRSHPAHHEIESATDGLHQGQAALVHGRGRKCRELLRHRHRRRFSIGQNVRRKG